MLLDSINLDIQSSLKKSDTVRLETLRFALSQIRYAVIAKYGTEWEKKTTDNDVLDAIKKLAKTHRESIDAFGKAGRNDLVEKEQKELDILNTFLPKELSDHELEALLTPLASSGEKNFGLLMKQAMAEVKGRADGGRVSAILKDLLSK